MALGRFPEAISEMERAVALDPLAPAVHSSYCRILYRARKYPEAKARCERAIELDPQTFSAYNRLSNVYDAMGDYPRALEAQKKQRGFGPGLARVYALMGRREEARKILSGLVTDSSQMRFGYDIATAYFALGEKDLGFSWLEKAFEQRDLVIFTKFDPKFDSVRHDPRFQALVKRLKIPD